MAYSYTLLCRAEILYSIQGRHSRLYGVRGTSGGLGGLTRRGEERRRNADGTLSGARSCALCGSQARGGRGGALAGAAGSERGVAGALQPELESSPGPGSQGVGKDAGVEERKTE